MLLKLDQVKYEHNFFFDVLFLASTPPSRPNTHKTCVVMCRDEKVTSSEMYTGYLNT